MINPRAGSTPGWAKVLWTVVTVALLLFAVMLLLRGGPPHGGGHVMGAHSPASTAVLGEQR